MKADAKQINRILKGIVAYRHEQQVILRLLRRYHSFTERDFDRWFRGREFKRRKFYPHEVTGDSFLLGIGINGFNQWAWNLELMQMMMVVGLIDAKKKNGLVVYELS